jgi:hypothetical protein
LTFLVSHYNLQVSQNQITGHNVAYGVEAVSYNDGYGFVIECKIEGVKSALSSYRRSVEMNQIHYDKRDNLERRIGCI